MIENPRPSRLKKKIGLAIAYIGNIVGPMGKCHGRGGKDLQEEKIILYHVESHGLKCSYAFWVLVFALILFWLAAGISDCCKWSNQYSCLLVWAKHCFSVKPVDSERAARSWYHALLQLTKQLQHVGHNLCAPHLRHHVPVEDHLSSQSVYWTGSTLDRIWEFVLHWRNLRSWRCIIRSLAAGLPNLRILIGKGNPGIRECRDPELPELPELAKIWHSQDYVRIWKSEEKGDLVCGTVSNSLEDWIPAYPASNLGLSSGFYSGCKLVSEGTVIGSFKIGISFCFLNCKVITGRSSFFCKICSPANTRQNLFWRRDRCYIAINSYNLEPVPACGLPVLDCLCNLVRQE